MINFAQFGNDLYTGKRSIDFIGRRRQWYLISAVLIILAALGLGVRHLNLGLEFRGGSEFRVAQIAVPSDYERVAKDALSSAAPGHSANVTQLGSGADGSVRVQTEELTAAQNEDVRQSLASAFGAAPAQVSASFVGPSWGASVSQKALQALVTFLILVALAMALYFRTWKMAVAGLIALAHDLVITVGVYALTGLEVTPASMIGFLTILGYSLYDTVVVFDKVRENTQAAFANGRSSYQQAANLAVNQTLVRSINTTVVALLPIGAILFVGFTILGPGTLLDLALALFIGISVGAYSSIFVATPILVTMRGSEPAVLELARRAERAQARAAKETQSLAQADPESNATAAVAAPVGGPDVTADDSAGSQSTATGRAVHKYAQQAGPRNQPRRTPKSKR
ncbi:MAG: protein translocase subunit SecF [Nostocoides sp.]